MTTEWTETIRRFGNYPDFHFEVSPDGDGASLEIRYREFDREKKQFIVRGTVSMDPKLAPFLAEAVMLVSEAMLRGEKRTKPPVIEVRPGDES